jgi:hypothetical protein
VVRKPEALEEVIWPTDQGYLYTGVNDLDMNHF